MKSRRFFAGSTLPQALMAAARYHGLSPEDLAYRLRDKRHGFVTRTRRFIVEIDPAAPQRTGSEARPPAAPNPPPVWLARRNPCPRPASARSPPPPSRCWTSPCASSASRIAC